MTVTFEQTLDHLVHFGEFHERQSPIARRFTALSYGGVFVAVAGVIVASRGADPIAILAGCIGGGVVTAVFVYWWNRWRRRWLVPRLLTEGQSRAQLGTCVVEIDAEGIGSRSAVGEARLSWAGIERVVHDTAFIYIYVTPVSALIIPKAAFATREAADAFLQTASDLHRGCARG